MLKRWLVVACLTLLAVQVVVQMKLAGSDSATTDEAVHLSAGYTYLTRGDFRFNPEHPPLVKILAALPLLALKPHISAEMDAAWDKSNDLFYDSWRENRLFGEKLMFEAGNNPDQLIFYGRLPMILLTLILGLTIFWIALRHWGSEAALVATGLYAFNPIVNGHGHLITTDIAISLGYLLSAYTFWRLVEKPIWKNAVWFGLAFGLALLSKHTAIIALPFFVLYAFGRWTWQKDWSTWRQVGLKFLGGLVITWIVIWAGFGFHTRIAPQTDTITADILGSYHRAGAATTYSVNPKLDLAYATFRPILIVLPADYIKGLLLITNHASGGHSSFLLGETSRTGWWYYFPILILFKVPLAMLLVFAGALFLTIGRRPREGLVVAVLTAAAVFLAVSIKSKADLGIRHILSIFPLLILASSYVASAHRKFLRLTYICLAWLAVVFIVSYPTYLGYFNELAGSRADNYQIANDSNLDWGQDLKRIAKYIDEDGVKNPYIEYSWLGNGALDYYLGKGNYRLLSDYSSGEGTAIIGATALTDPIFSHIAACPDKRIITNGVFTCSLGL